MVGETRHCPVLNADGGGTVWPLGQMVPSGSVFLWVPHGKENGG